MKSLVSVCLFWLGFVGYGQTAPQYPNTNYLGEYDGYYYYSSVNSYNWHQSVNHLKTIDTSFRLLSIHSQDENDWVTESAFQFYNTHHYLWIGGTDQVTEGTFVWEDKTPWDYTNWGDGEPNNSYQIGEDWVMLNYPHPGKWNDATNTGGDIFYYLFKVKKPKVLPSIPTLEDVSTDFENNYEVEPDGVFNVYPTLFNPNFTTSITFEIPQTILDKNSIISIKDAGGKVVVFKPEVFTSTEYSLPVPGFLSQGTYHGLLVSERKRYYFKLVVTY
jgi:hypothetical protein